MRPSSGGHAAPEPERALVPFGKVVVVEDRFAIRIKEVMQPSRKAGGRS
jgi:hypothetical protein